MKILFLSPKIDHSDSRLEREILCLGKKYEIELLCWDRSVNIPKIKTEVHSIKDVLYNCHIIGIKAPFGMGMKKMAIPLIRFWLMIYTFIRNNKFRYDVIHACDFDSAFPLLFIPHLPIIVYDIFDYYADAHKAPRAIDKVLRRFESKIIQKGNAVILCSEKRRRQIYPAVPQNLIIIHNTPSVNYINYTKINTMKIRERHRIVYVGVLSEERFLREISEVVASRTDIELHIGGIGLLENYFYEESKKQDNIIYYGRMEYNDVLALEQQCDIMTAIYDPRIPNHKYAAPNKFYEALMLKKPLIMMRNTGMDSFVEEYQLGEVIDGGAETFKEGFSHALDNLIARKAQWAEMGERGYKLYKEQFSWDEMEKRLLKMYEGLSIN